MSATTTAATPATPGTPIDTDADDPPQTMVPSSTDFVLAIALGMGWGMVPDLQRSAGALHLRMGIHTSICDIGTSHDTEHCVSDTGVWDYGPLMGNWLVRHVRRDEFEAWTRLYRGYAAFYTWPTWDEHQRQIWGWIHDEGLVEALVAEVEDFEDLESVNHYRHAVEAGEDPDTVLEALRTMSRDNARTPMQCNAARTVCEVVFVAPATEPSACPKRTMRLP